MSAAYGFLTLIKKELHRFFSIWSQSLLSPVLTTLLYFLVFGYSLGDRLSTIQGVPYVAFLTPGLVMFGTISSAFVNSAFSLFITKINGSVVDLLVAPFTTTQLLAGYVVAAMVRAVLVGTLIWMVAVVFGVVGLAHAGYVVAFLLLTSAMFGALGVIVAVFASSFDHLNFFPTFLITPLAFLGGVFYSIEALPEPWRSVSQLNPVLYLVNGLRYGFVGVSDVDPALALLVTSVAAVAVVSVTWWILHRGYRLKS
jgi:ABC-2 type transport system permease protein